MISAYSCDYLIDDDSEKEEGYWRSPYFDIFAEVIEETKASMYQNG